MSVVKKIVSINEGTGEYSDRVVPDGYQVRLVSEKSIDAFKKLKDGKVDIHEREWYVKVYFRQLDMLLSEELSPTELRLVLASMRFCLKFETGELVYPNMEPVSASELCQKAGVNKSRGMSALRSLVEKQILDKERRGRSFVYLANPYIFMRGNKVSEELFERFCNTKWAYVSYVPEQEKGQLPPLCNDSAATSCGKEFA